MNGHQEFKVSHRLRSIRCAVRGLRVMLISQHNAWIHAAATVLVLIAGFIFRLSAMEWCWIVAAIVMVWTAEALNTALEVLCDVASPGFHPLVEKAKDVAAGGVLVSAIGAAIIGLLILGPDLVLLIRGAQ